MNLYKHERESLTSVNINEHEVRRRACCLANKIGKFVKKNLMLILTFAGIVLGFSIGFAVRTAQPSKDTLIWIGMPGELFLRTLKLLILPLIVCSVISGSAALDPKSNGKISAISFLFIVITNVLAGVFGVALCIIFKPGDGVLMSKDTKETAFVETQDIFIDLLRNLFPDNMIKATFSQSQTENKQGTNVLGLITVCTLVGIASSRLKDRVKVFIQFFQAGADIILQILRWILWTTPVGVASLIAVSMAGITDISTVFAQLGMFVLTVTTGIAIHQLVFLPLVLFILTRRNPYLYLITLVKPWMIGLATTSTAVAIPEMLNACEEKNKIDKRVSRFVIPFCVTLNADGSALFISAAAVFLATITGMSLSAADYIIICMLTGFATLALPSIPSSSIVTLVMVLTSLNIPAGQISLLFAVEWYLDRLRTTSNVVSHTFCTAVTYHFCKNDLNALDSIPCDDMELVIDNPDIQHDVSERTTGNL
ncbi:SLC1A2 [Mytilus coruscus]|uniref:Amino acid transporter n=1 Tax=Mytilus coruscus TaxID=42192 RepID=A0A6J8E6Q3_MYTCO|nr:SLC1A2 [Mytilus coruscus]